MLIRCYEGQAEKLPMPQTFPGILNKHRNRSEERDGLLVVKRPPGTIRLSIYHAITTVLLTHPAVRCPIRR